jgi:hypothetical protein
LIQGVIVSKNIVIMPAFLTGPEPQFVKNSKRAWMAWCEKYGHEFISIDTPIAPFEQIKPQIQKMWTMDILEANDIEFDQIAQVDYDTYPTDTCPDFFEMTNHNFAAVLDGGWLPALNRISRITKEMWFEDTTVTLDEFFNTGFVVFNKSHKPQLDLVKDFFTKHPEDLDNRLRYALDDQIVLNYAVKQSGCPVTFLPRSFNMVSPENERFFWEGPDHEGRLYDIKTSIRQCVNIFHFTGDTQRRNMLTGILDSFMWKGNFELDEFEPVVNKLDVRRGKVL